MNDSDILALVTANYTPEQLRKKYINLKRENLRIKDCETTDTLKLAHLGNPCSNQFFLKHRLHSRTERKQTIFEWVRKVGREEWEKQVVKNNNKNKKKQTLQDAIAGDYLSTASNHCGKVPSQFKPRIASMMVEIFKPTCVLDFCAGWGDRCVGVGAKGIKYIGIDSNQLLEPTYREMIDFYKIDATMRFQPSETVDFSEFKYDMILTSPPYFTLERYENMPPYESYQNWVDVFLRPVVTNAFTHLADQGWMCLNVPSQETGNYPIYESIVEFLGLEHKRVKMCLQSQSKKERYEYIYCWKKGAPAPVPQVQVQAPVPPVQAPVPRVEEEEQVIILNIKGKNYSTEVKNGQLIIRIK